MEDQTLPLFNELDNPFEEDFYENRHFEDINYQGKNLQDKDFYRCTFEGCKFLESAFDKCRFENCSFKSSDLSLIKLGYSSFIDVKFEGSKLLGINWTQAANPISISFLKCTINHSVFLGLRLHKIDIIECIAKEADFTEANLTSARFTSTDLQGSRFLNTNLTQTDFSNALNYSIDPQLNKLKKTKFSLPEALSLLNYFDIILK